MTDVCFAFVGLFEGCDAGLGRAIVANELIDFVKLGTSEASRQRCDLDGCFGSSGSKSWITPAWKLVTSFHRQVSHTYIASS